MATEGENVGRGERRAGRPRAGTDAAALGPRFVEAVGFALDCHAHQRRKLSGAPYMAHLLAVAAIVLESGGQEDEAIAALLHDAIEDAGGAATAVQIRTQFGPRVAQIVAQCSDTDQIPKPPWAQRKAAFIARLPSVSAAARLVIAADKLHNVRSLLSDYHRRGEEIWAQFRGGRDGTLGYYRAVCAALENAGGGPLVDELRRAIAELDRAVAGRAEAAGG